MSSGDSDTLPVASKSISCQGLLANRPSHSGWLRRKSNLYHIGEKISEKVHRAASLTSKLPWERRFVILSEGSIYVYQDETAEKPSKVLNLTLYNRVMVSTDSKTKEVPWPFKVVSDDQSLKDVHFSSTSQDDQQKWLEAIEPELSVSSPVSNRPLPTTPTPPNKITSRSGKPLPSTPDNRRPSDVDDDDDEVVTPTSRRDPFSKRVVPQPPTGRKQGKDLPIPDSQPRPTKPVKPTAASKPPIPVQKPTNTFHKDSAQEEYEEQITYEAVDGGKDESLESQATWDGTNLDAQNLMKSCEEDGTFMLRPSTDGNGKTLLVYCESQILKYPIRCENNKKKIFGQDYNNMEELLNHYRNNSFPNRNLKLKSPYSKYVDEASSWHD